MSNSPVTPQTEKPNSSNSNNSKIPLIALIGLPNSGKSTLINRICGFRKAITANEAGTTRDLTFGEDSWENMYFRLVDTGGLEVNPLGDIKKLTQIKTLSAIAEADLLVWVIDRKQNPETISLEITQKVWKLGKPFLIGINKVDSPNAEKDISEYAKLGGNGFVNFSAASGFGIGDLLDLMVENLEKIGFDKKTDFVIDQNDVEKLETQKRGKKAIGKSQIVRQNADGTYFVTRENTRRGPGNFQAITKDELENFEQKRAKQPIENLIFDFYQVLFDQDVAGFIDHLCQISPRTRDQVALLLKREIDLEKIEMENKNGVEFVTDLDKNSENSENNEENTGGNTRENATQNLENVEEKLVKTQNSKLNLEQKSDEKLEEKPKKSPKITKTGKSLDKNSTDSEANLDTNSTANSVTNQTSNLTSNISNSNRKVETKIEKIIKENVENNELNTERDENLERLLQISDSGIIEIDRLTSEIEILIESKFLGQIDWQTFWSKIRLAAQIADLSWDVWDDWTVVLDEAEEFLKNQKKLGKKIYYLTNILSQNYKRRQEEELYTYFDGGIASCDVGLKKPDKMIFENLISKYKLDASKTVFIDDNEQNITSARELGLWAIHYIHGFTDLDFEMERIENAKVLQTPKIPKILFLGKPNVGKSSLFNALARENLQIITSTAGTTLSVNDTMIERSVRIDGQIQENLAKREDEKLQKEQMEKKLIEDEIEKEAAKVKQKEKKRLIAELREKAGIADWSEDLDDDEDEDFGEDYGNNFVE